MSDKVHNLILESRKKLSISAVNDVDSFDEHSVCLRTQMGDLLIKGFDLHLNKLSIESEEIIVEGEIESICYQDERSDKKGGFFSRILR